MAIALFAGIPVRDFGAALDWYTRLLGTAPSMFPHDTEAVWELAEGRSVYVALDPERAGHAVAMAWVDDLDAVIAAIAERGIEAERVEEHGGARKVVYRDADGNELGFGGAS